MVEIPSWVAPYVGLPFADRGRTREIGFDCWGLVRLVYAERFAIILPSYLDDYSSVYDPRLGEIVPREAASGWVEIPPGLEAEGDVVILRILRLPVHVGIVVAPGRMLHTEKETDSATADYRGLRWNRRVEGFRRHPARLGA